MKRHCKIPNLDDLKRPLSTADIITSKMKATSVTGPTKRVRKVKRIKAYIDLNGNEV